jgi:hypothetical protein
VRKGLIIAGVLLVAIGLAWPWLKERDWWRHIGHLPGDIHIAREGFSFHFPLTSCIVISLLLSVIVWLARR